MLGESTGRFFKIGGRGGDEEISASGGPPSPPDKALKRVFPQGSVLGPLLFLIYTKYLALLRITWEINGLVSL